MTLRIFNTLTHRKEDFVTLKPGKVRMYVCGPTVYDSAHLGHAMSAIVNDVVRRYLEYLQYDVTFAFNFTDVDDKIINRANALGEDPNQLAEQYIQEYLEMLDQLNIQPATVYPRATGEIEGMKAIIQGLIEKGFAYPVEGGDVYFRVRRDPDYGKLSGRSVDEMRSGARVEVDDRKEDPLDFALWKAAKPGEPAWDSPWGPGRPGWHIECSAMNLHYLGEQIDIHGGGNDLIFPHHENEIAQTESFTGKPFARYWIHNGMLNLSGEKMSKSLGNLVKVKDFLQEHDADVLRLLVLGSSYRAPLTYNSLVVEQAARGLERIRSALRPAGKPKGGADISALEQTVAQVRPKFMEAMDDDFNTSAALAVIYDLVTAINKARDEGVAEGPFTTAQTTLRELAGVLGLRLVMPDQTDLAAAPFIDLLVQIRQELRQARQFALADRIRQRLTELDVVLEDSADGTVWRKG